MKKKKVALVKEESRLYLMFLKMQFQTKPNDNCETMSMDQKQMQGPHKTTSPGLRKVASYHRKSDASLEYFLKASFLLKKYIFK